MNADHLILEKHLKKASIYTNFISGLVAVVVAMSVGYGFYYNTRATLEQHTTDIQEVKSDVNEIKKNVQETNVFKGVSEIEVQVLSEKINAIESNVSKMDEKLDKILMQTR